MQNFRMTQDVQIIPIGQLVLPKRTTRKHSVQKIAALASSITDTGFFSPILVDESMTIIAGHARVAAARRLGMDSVPAFIVNGLSELQRRRLALADNKLAENASWDEETLAAELRELFESDPLNIDLTGFSIPEIDMAITPRPLGLDDEQADIPEPPEKAVSRLGDKWLCGSHVVVCGNSTNEAAYNLALGDQKADVVFVDAPYGIEIATEISQRGRRKHGNFVMASGEMGDDALAGFFDRFMRQLKSYSREGAVIFSCIDWRHVQSMLQVSQAIFGPPLALCVWVKTGAGLGMFYRSQHELVIVLRNGTKPHLNNLPLARKRKFRTNCWTYAGNTSNTKARREELASHPTVKPTAMIADALEDVSKPGDLVLDAFGGSGSTMIAAHAIKRRAVLIELDPKYVDLILLQFRKATGIGAVLEDGSTFDEVKKQRQETENVKFPPWPRS